jgi:hypothetical protein
LDPRSTRPTSRDLAQPPPPRAYILAFARNHKKPQYLRAAGLVLRNAAFTYRVRVYPCVRTTSDSQGSIHPFRTTLPHFPTTPGPASRRMARGAAGPHGAVCLLLEAISSGEGGCRVTRGHFHNSAVRILRGRAARIEQQRAAEAARTRSVLEVSLSPLPSPPLPPRPLPGPLCPPSSVFPSLSEPSARSLPRSPLCFPPSAAPRPSCTPPTATLRLLHLFRLSPPPGRLPSPSTPMCLLVVI